jgi:hypothetical protein
VLDLMFFDFTDIGITFLDSRIIKPDPYHPPFVTDIILPLASPTQNCEYSCGNFASGENTSLYNILPTYDWSCVYDINSAEAAVVQNAMEQTVPP